MLINDAERAARVADATGSADEYRRLVGPDGTLSGLTAPTVARRILSPKWSGERFWVVDTGRRVAPVAPVRLCEGPGCTRVVHGERRQMQALYCSPLCRNRAARRPK